MSEILKQGRSKLAAFPAVVGVSWGAKYRAGHSAGDRALIVWVKRKIQMSALSPDQVLPRQFSAKIGRTTQTVPIDVQSLGRGAKHGRTSDLRPGKRVTVNVKGERGALSAYFEPVGAGRALISGHVAVRRGNAVSATLTDGTTLDLGTVGTVRDDSSVDAALVTNAPTSNLGALILGPARIRDLSGDDVGVLVRVLRPQGTVEAAIDAVNAPADFGSDGHMKGLIRLDRRVTDAGDSGSPVVDLTGMVVGFVVGFASVEDDDGVVRSHTFALTSRSALNVAPSA